MSELSISELQARTGLASSALRFYERKGLLRATGRSGGKRTYDQTAIEQVALIDLLKLAGFTLSEIAAFVDPVGRSTPQWRALASAKQQELEERLRRTQEAQAALAHMLACRHEHLEECAVHHRMLREHAESLALAAQESR
ncbi:MerR family transcriptional regulator [Kribbella sp. NPDC059898]|uniref:MerR family transcriptional regulator n=1 Tax=Kribbella sp. NPDC059898 TaxID=3346995 RepID=UPI00365F887E